jgi:hypothetical protein
MDLEEYVCGYYTVIKIVNIVIIMFMILCIAEEGRIGERGGGH